MARIRTAHTARLGADTLAAAHALLVATFDDLTAEDWEHCLGGMHVLVHDDDGALVGHAALVQRRLLHRGRALRTGYVEGVAVRAGHRREGHGAAMLAALREVARRAYDIAALSATDDAGGFYAALGWTRWRGPSSALTPAGIRRTPDDDGGIFVLPFATTLDVDGEITCDWRDGDVW